MDFDYDIYDSPDGLFGAMADDGSWNGVMNELINKVLVLCSQASLFSWPLTCALHTAICGWVPAAVRTLDRRMGQMCSLPLSRKARPQHAKKVVL